jgi:hypothetical protein
MAIRNFVAWRYTDDNGQVFVRRADALLTAQQGDNDPDIAVGGSTATGLVPYTEMPRNLRPRSVSGVDGGGYKGKVVIYDPAAFTAIVVNQTTFVVHDGGGTAHTCTVKSKTPEGAHGTIF